MYGNEDSAIRVLASMASCLGWCTCTQDLGIEKVMEMIKQMDTAIQEKAKQGAITNSVSMTEKFNILKMTIYQLFQNNLSIK